MAKRRPSGDGMVRKRNDGRWEGRIVVGHKENGDSIFRYLYADTQKELSAKLRQFIDAYRGVDLTEQSGMTFTEWVDQWLKNIAGSVRPSTLDEYQKIAKNHLTPYLGDRPLSQIHPKSIQQLYETLATSGAVGKETGLASGTVHLIQSILHQVLDAAKLSKLISQNPVDEIPIPKYAYRPKKVLTEEQLTRFYAAVRADPTWSDFFYTEIATGLRQGEICSLRWEDLDESTGTLKIRRSVRIEKGGKVVLTEPKTALSKRDIILPPSTAQLLRERKRSSCSEWIFPDLLHPERPTRPHAAYTRLKRLLKQANLPDIRFHDLRHTFATHALSSGVDVKTLSGILGHTQAAFTMDTYTHTTSDTLRRTAEITELFMTDIFGKELRPWEESAKAAMEPSV